MFRTGLGADGTKFHVQSGKNSSPPYGLNLDTYGNVMSGSINGPVVIPFEPYQSLLYIKCTPEFLQNSDLSTGGVRMPKENESFFDDNPEKLQLIHDWITDGCIE